MTSTAAYDESMAKQADVHLSGDGARPVEPTSNGQVVVDVPVVGDVTQVWAEIFAAQPFAPELAVSEPEFVSLRDGDQVFRITTDLSRLESYINFLQERLKQTNTLFNERVLPGLEREEQEAQNRSAAAQKLMDDAQVQLDRIFENDKNNN
jgi:hypothetical protein